MRTTKEAENEVIKACEEAETKLDAAIVTVGVFLSAIHEQLTRIADALEKANNAR